MKPQAKKAVESSEPDQADFSLVLGGPLYQLLRRARLSDDALALTKRRIATFVVLCWLPLALLATAEGQLWHGEVAVPFLLDIVVHVRFLVALPVLVLAELVVHQRMRSVVAQFLERGLVAERDLPRFHAAIASAMRLRNSVTAEILLITFVYVVGVLIVWRQYIAPDATTWYMIRSGAEWEPSLAGLWFGYVSLPVFQFLLARWYFRIFVWARFLWQVARLDLRLVPTHPDRAGGLGFLSNTVYAFVPLLMAHGVLLGGVIAERIFFLSERLIDFKIEVLALVAFLLLLVQGPLLAFAPRLAAARREGLREYGVLAQRYVRGFDRKWLRGDAQAEASMLGNADIQSLADLGKSFANVQEMGISLVSRDAIVLFAGATVAPIVPLALTMMPIDELITRLFGILF